MSLEIEYVRLYQRNEPGSLQNIFVKNFRHNIKSRYPRKIIDSILDKHAKNFVLYTAVYDYQSELWTKDKDKPLGGATIYHPTQVKKKKLKNLREMVINSIKLIF